MPRRIPVCPNAKLQQAQQEMDGAAGTDRESEMWCSAVTVSQSRLADQSPKLISVFCQALG